MTLRTTGAMSALSDRYTQVKAMIPSGVKLIAVSKKRTVEEIKALYGLGHRAFGENYPQELRDKQPQLPDDIEWHFIGHLQANKVKYITPFVRLIHTVDGARLLDEIQKRAASVDRTIDVLIQVHIAREETKFGLDAQEALELLSQWDRSRWSLVRPKGLMGMATNTLDGRLIRAEFEGLRELFVTLRGSERLDPGEFTELSMGMSGDLQEALAAGSTMVRVGTALFGPRE